MNAQDLLDISRRPQHGRERPKQAKDMKRKGERKANNLRNGEEKGGRTYREEITTYKQAKNVLREITEGVSWGGGGDIYIYIRCYENR